MRALVTVLVAVFALLTGTGPTLAQSASDPEINWGQTSLGNWQILLADSTGAVDEQPEEIRFVQWFIH